MINVFEASFHRFGHDHFGKDLESEEWRREILTDDGIGRLADLSWDKVHAVEVKDWIEFLQRVRGAKVLPKDALADPETFSPPDLTPAFQILRMAKYVRNRTFHRDEPLIVSQLRTALKIPRVLKDDNQAEELEAMYTVIVDDPTLDAPSGRWVRDILFPPEPEHGTCLQIATTILHMLEEGCFHFAQPQDPCILAEKSWTEPSHGEMQIYAHSWENAPRELNHQLNITQASRSGEECTDLDSHFFQHHQLRNAVLSHAVDLRNSVSHRNPIDERDARHSTWNAMLCFILMGDWIRAVEVEKLVEAVLTKTSQSDALARLRDASENDKAARRKAIIAICRREGVIVDRSDTLKRNLASGSSAPISEVRSKWSEISKFAEAKPSLTDDEKVDL